MIEDFNFSDKSLLVTNFSEYSVVLFVDIVTLFLHLNEEPPNSKYSHMIYYRQS